MKVLFTYSLIIAIVFACTKELDGVWVPDNTAVIAGVNPVFVPYVKSFYDDAKRINPAIEGRWVPIGFSKSLLGDYIGVCYSFGVFRWIFVSEEYWNESSNTEREILLYHELGHCVLNRGHEQYGIMEPQVINPYYYTAHKESLKIELFTGGDNE